jgi:hypothetical protein
MLKRKPNKIDGSERCKFCKEPITFDGIGAWLDSTDGDGCSGDDECNNEGESHVPAQIDGSGAKL